MLSEDINDQENIANALTNLAEINKRRGNYFRANEQLMQVLRINEDIDDIRTVAATLTCIGDNLLYQKEFDKAIGYFRQSLLIADSIGAKPEVLDNYSKLVKAYSAITAFDEADSFQQLHSDLYYLLRTETDTIKTDNELPSINPDSVQTDAGLYTVIKWLIAFSVIILIFISSVTGFRDYRNR